MKFWASPENYQYLDFRHGSQWSGKSMKVHELSSWNGGKTYNMENGTLLFGSYFFMTGTIVEHKYTAFNIVNVLS